MAKVIVIGSYAESLVNLRGALLRMMVRCGHHVVAAAPGISDRVALVLQGWGIAVCRIDLARTGCNPFRDMATLRELVRVLKREKPDYLLAYTVKPVIYGCIAARITKVPCVFSMITGLGFSFSRASRQSKMVGVLVSLLYRVALAKNQCVFFQNPDDLSFFLQKRLICREADRSRVIHGSGVDVEEFFPAPLPASVSFIMIARFLREKGVLEYLRAAQRIKRNYPTVQCYLAGWFDKNPNGISRQELQPWIKSDSIRFLGRLDDVKPAIAAGSVFVLPSYYREGIPRAILEAMAMGRPIITTDAPGCRETVEHGSNGFLVPIRSVVKLFLSMEWFIQHPGMVVQMGEKSREFAEERFDVRKVNTDILTTMGLL